jgi:hypothetical protein
MTLTQEMSKNSESSFYKRKLPLLLTCQLHQEPMLVWLLLQSAGEMPRKCQQVLKCSITIINFLNWKLSLSENNLEKQHMY